MRSISASALLLPATICFSSMANAAQPGSPAPKAFTDNTVRWENVAYVSSDSSAQVLDLYAPKDGTNLPLIIWIHGGAFLFGSKDDILGEPVVLGLLLNGYAVAAINYRLSPEALFPAQLEDCKAAVRWLRAHAQQFGIDSKRIGIWGPSAGGYLATFLGVTGETHEFDVGENLNWSSRVQAVCDFFGPTDFLQMDAHRLPDGISTMLQSLPNRNWSAGRFRIIQIRSNARIRLPTLRKARPPFLSYMEPPIAWSRSTKVSSWWRL
jgi:acetyl esterase/lipase